MTRDEFYDHVPQIVLDAVLNYEISGETVPEIFENIDDLLGDEELDLIVGGPPVPSLFSSRALAIRNKNGRR